MPECSHTFAGISHSRYRSSFGACNGSLDVWMAETRIASLMTAVFLNGQSN